MDLRATSCIDNLFDGRNILDVLRPGDCMLMNAESELSADERETIRKCEPAIDDAMARDYPRETEFTVSLPVGKTRLTPRVLAELTRRYQATGWPNTSVNSERREITLKR